MKKIRLFLYLLAFMLPISQVNAQCIIQMSGTYTIGTTGNYASFTAAVNDLSSLGVCGPVVFNVLPGSGPYNEQITIPFIIGASATNTITFNGNGETITFLTTASPGNYIIRLDGATYITFDSLNVVTQTSLNNFAIHFTNDANFNTINNCAINLSSTFSSTSTSNAGIVVSGSLTSATTAGSSGANNTFTNNHIIGGYYGLTINGASSTNTSMNNTIENNIIEDFRLYGTYLRSISNSSISFNDISRPNRTTNLTTFYGLYFLTGGEGNTIEGNRIHDPFRSLGGVSTSSSYAIYHSAVDVIVNANRVFNNLIYNMNSNGSIYGLYNSSSDGIHYYHNTISLDDQNATGGITRGFYQTTTASNIEFKNNIITVTRSGTGTKYCIYFASTTSTITSDNNVLYMNAAAGTNNLGYYGGNQATLLNWQTATSGDANSVDADPLYISLAADNFTPTSPLVDGIADASVGVTTDIFGTTRAASPDPGAIEFTPPSCPQPSNLTAINITGFAADLSWLETGSATTWQLDWDTAGVALGNGNLLITTTNPHSLTSLSPQSEYRYYVRSICTPGDTSFWAGPFVFTTLCVNFNAPWIDDVEAHALTTNSTIEDCWSSSPSGTTTAFRWNVGTGSTPSINTGPSGAYSGNNYFHVEASSGVSGAVAELYSPLIDVSSLTTPELQFYYHMYGSDIATLFIDIFNGNNWVAVDSIIGQRQTATTDPWTQHNIVINGFPDTIQVRFRAIRGASYEGDISIDDIEIFQAAMSCVQPSNLAATNITTTSADLSWTENGTATTWDIEWGTAGFTPTGTPTIVGTTTNPHNLTGLTASTSYDFYVRSDCGASGTSGWSGPFTFTTLATCVQPSNLAATNITTTSADLSWTENGTATTWDIEWGTAGFTPTGTPTIVGTTTNPHNLSGLTASTSYDFYVRSDCGASGTSGWSGPFTFTTLATCVQPSNLAATNITTTSADLSWTENGTATTWDIEWGTAGFTPTGTPTIVGTTTNPHNLTGLTASTSYDFYVRSDCGASGTSGWSGPFTFTTLATCVQPSNLAATNITTTSADLSWTENGTATTWDIEWGTAGFTPTGTPTIVGTTTNPHNLSGLTASTSYDFYVRSDCGASGTSGWSGPFTFTTTTPATCVQPSNLAATNITTTSADLSWTENGTATTWDIEWGTAGFTPTGTPTIVGTTTNPHNLTGLTASTSYDFYVRSDCGASGTSGWSGPFTFTTTTPATCVQPSNLAATNITTTSADLSWTENGTATTWDIEWGTAGFTPTGTPTIVGTTTNPHNLTGLTASTSYDFYVRSDCGASGTSGWSGPFTFTTTTPATCVQPSNLAATNITTTSADLSWTENGTATTWDIEWGTAGFTPTGTPTIVGTTTNPHNLTGLTASTSYDFYVRSDCGASGTSGWSGPFTFTTTTPATCVQPSNLAATNITTTSADLSWTENGTATTWDIEWGTAGFTPTGTPTIVGTTTNPHNLTGLTASTSYDFYVRSDCGASGTSGWSGPFTFTTSSCMPIGLDLGMDTIVCSKDSILLDAGSGGNYTYSWSTGGTAQTELIDTTLMGGNGTYNVSVTVTDVVTGCVYTDDINITFQLCTDIDELGNENAIAIYPNPTNGLLNVMINGVTVNTTLTIVDVQGKVVYAKNNFTNSTSLVETIDLSGNDKGIYFISLTTDKTTVVKKVILH